jgi:hypothetical protein
MSEKKVVDQKAQDSAIEPKEAGFPPPNNRDFKRWPPDHKAADSSSNPARKNKSTSW